MKLHIISLCILIFTVYNCDRVSANECIGPYPDYDIIIVLDTSASITDKYNAKSRNFIGSFLDHFHIGSDATRIGFITFNNNAKVEFKRNSGLTKLEMIDIIKGGFKPKGDAILEKALMGIQNEFKSRISGRMTETHKSRRNIAVVLTYRPNGNNTAAQEMAGKLKSTMLIMVSIGATPDLSILQSFASKSTLVFDINSGNYDTIARNVARVICDDKSTTKPTPTTPTIITTTPTSTDLKCEKVLDLIFILQSTDDIDMPAFTKRLTFITDIANSFTIASALTRIGLISYAEKAAMVMKTDNSLPMGQLSDTISSCNQMEGKANLHVALNMLNEKSCSDRKSSTPRVALFLLHKRSADIETTRAAIKSVRMGNQDMKIMVIVVNSDDRVLAEEAFQLASSPFDVLYAHNEDDLQSIQQTVVSGVCSFEGEL